MNVIKCIGKYIWYSLAGIIILFATLSVLLETATPILNSHKGVVEQQLSKYLHHDISIGEIDAKWARFGPEFQFKNVVIAQEGQAFVSAKELDIYIGIFKSLFDRELYFHSFVLSGAEFKIVQASESAYVINDSEKLNINNQASNKKNKQWLNWLVWQKRLSLKNASISYQALDSEPITANIDELEFSNVGGHRQVYAKLFFGGWQHEAITLMARLRGDADRIKRLDAQVYLFSSHVNLHKLAKVLNISTNVEDGYANAQLWIEVNKGKVAHTQGLFSFKDVVVQTEKQKIVIPELRQVNAYFSGKFKKGRFAIAVNQGELLLDKYFENSIVADNAFFQGDWQNTSGGFRLNANKIMAENKSAKVSASLGVSFPQNGDIDVDLRGAFSVVNPKAILAYLPQKKFHQPLKDWLSAAIIDGKQTQGEVVFRGKPSEYPFRQHEGVWKINGDISDLTFQYAKGWPVIEDIKGSIGFDGVGMHIAVDSASTGNILLQDVVANMLDITNKHTQLTISGQTEEDSIDAFEFIHASPLDASLGVWLSPLDLKGKLSVNLDLLIPMDNIAKGTQINGDLFFHNNQLDIVDWGNLLNSISGKLSFTRHTVFAKALAAKFGEHDVDIAANTLSDDGVHSAVNVLFDGRIDEDDLALVLNNPSLSDYLSGESSYRGYLIIPIDAEATSLQLSVASELVGMKVDLPEPLAKEAAEEKPFSVDAALSMTKRPTQVMLNYADDVSIAVNYQSGRHSEETPYLDIDAEAAALAWPVSFTGKKVSAGTSKLMDLLRHIHVSTPKLTAYHIPLTQVGLAVDMNDKQEIVTIKSQEIAGDIRLSDDKTVPLMMAFDYVILPKFINAETEKMTSDVGDIPPLYIDIKRTTLNQHYYGRVVLKTSQLANGLSIDELKVDAPLFSLDATGSWLLEDGQYHSTLKGESGIPNVGNLINSYDQTKKMQAKQGKVDFNLSWPAAPYQFKLNQASGQVEIEVLDGEIPMDEKSVAMGLGKVLSLFSLESIKRRLKLDFSDLTKDGYAYNVAKAEIKLKAGEAYFRKSFFNGPLAKIDYKGRVGLVAKDYDIDMAMTPYVTSTLPLIATLAGGPLAGVATYAVDKLVGNNIKNLTKYQYYLKGTWEHPELINVMDEVPNPRAPVVEGNVVAYDQVVHGNNAH